MVPGIHSAVFGASVYNLCGLAQTFGMPDVGPPLTRANALPRALEAFTHRDLETAILRMLEMRIFWLDADAKRQILVQLADRGQAIIPSPRVHIVRGCAHDPLQIVLEVLNRPRRRPDQPPDRENA